MSQADREKWEARYAGDDGGEVRRVDPFLEQVAEELPSSGRALDLAGGTGRNALFLSRRGLNVTLVDISSQGLARARSAAEAEGLSISTQSLDLDENSLPDGPFDLVVCTWFLLDARNWKEIASALGSDGRVVYVQPTPEHCERHAHPSRRFTVEFSELKAAISAARIHPVRLEQGWDENGNHTARLLGRPFEGAEDPREGP